MATKSGHIISGVKAVTPNRGDIDFVERIKVALSSGEVLNRIRLEKIARELGIRDKTEVKELTELALLRYGRNLVSRASSVKAAYERLVELYAIQPNSSFRSSESVRMQQYSTPLPISYLLGAFVDGMNPRKYFLEPSAGNGLLTIGLNPSRTHVNELDSVRFSILRRQGFWALTRHDASMPMPDVWQNYDGVISNPPFGKFKDFASCSMFSSNRSPGVTREVLLAFGVFLLTSLDLISGFDDCETFPCVGVYNC